MTGTIINIGGIAGSIITIITLIMLIVKPTRNTFIKCIKKTSKVNENDKIIFEMNEMLKKHIEQDINKKEVMALQSEALLCVLRSEITDTYYKYITIKQLRTYERENLVKSYNIYHSLNGNSYVTIIYDEMMTWEVIQS